MAAIIMLLRVLITLVMALSTWIVTAIVLLHGWPVEEGGTFGHIITVATLVAIGVGLSLWKSETKPRLDKTE
jgi:hypothetical protein